MTTPRKITLTFLDEKKTKTTGWPLRYAARQLGIWPDKTAHIVQLRETIAVPRW